MSDAAFELPFEEEEPPRRRRRAWPWLVTLAIVLALLAGAAVGAEWLARGMVQGAIRTLVVSQLDLGGSDVDVELGDGLVIPQVLSGRLNEVTVSSDDVEVGPVSGDARVTITDMPIRADAAAGPGTATVRVDEEQLQSLLATTEGFPADAVGIAAPEVSVSTDLSVLGIPMPVSVDLQPGAADGQLTLTPTRFIAAGAEVSPEELRSRLGGLADPFTRTWNICIAQHLPAALTLTSVTAEESDVVATFDIDGAVVVDSALRQKGSCG